MLSNRFIVGFTFALSLCAATVWAGLDWTGGGQTGSPGPPGASGGGAGDITTDDAWTTSGQLIQAHGNASAVVLAPGSAGQVLHHNGTLAYWDDPTVYEAANANIQSHISGTADIHGLTGLPASATTLTNHVNGTADMHGASGATVGLTTFNGHANSTANPHSVTAAQISAEPANEHINSSTISIATLDMTSSTSSIPWTVTAAAHANASIEGLAHWNSSTDTLTIGNGATATTIGGGGDLSTTDIDTSSELSTILTDEIGTGSFVLHTNATLVTPAVGAATGTSLALTGNLTGKVPATAHNSASTTLAATEVLGNMHYNASAITAYYQLPDATEGMSVCIYSHVNNSLIIDPNGTNTIHLNGSAAEGSGYRIVSDGTRSAFVCLMSLLNDFWAVLGSKGTWTGTGAD